MEITLLPNTHVSPDTAYVVADYPYGFRLRCQIRYWLDVHPKRGVRFMSQTSNPKRPGLVWNKPKASTYSRFGGAMYLDANGHVQHAGLTEYTDAAEAEAFRNTYGPAVPVVAQPTMNAWVAAKQVVAAKLAEGANLSQAGAAGTIAFVKAMRQEGNTP